MRAQTRIVLPLIALLLGSLPYCSSRAGDWKEDRRNLRTVIENKVKLEVGRRLNPPAIAEDLGLSYPPQEPTRPMDEVKIAAAEAARKKVDEQFPPEQIEQFRQEAEEAYAPWETGQDVSFVIRGGRGRTPSVTGTLRHVSPTRVQVDNRWISRQDIDKETLAHLDPEIHESVVDAQVRKMKMTREIERERLYDKVYAIHGKRLMEESHYVRWKDRWVAAAELFEKALEFHRRKLAEEIRPDIEHKVFTDNKFVQDEGEWMPKEIFDRRKNTLSNKVDEDDPIVQPSPVEHNDPDHQRAPLPPYPGTYPFPYFHQEQNRQ